MTAIITQLDLRRMTRQEIQILYRHFATLYDQNIDRLGECEEIEELRKKMFLINEAYYQKFGEYYDC